MTRPSLSTSSSAFHVEHVKRWKEADVKRMELVRTSNREHLQPRPVLQNADQAYDADDPKGEYRQLLGELVHVQLERCPSFLNLLNKYTTLS